MLHPMYVQVDESEKTIGFEVSLQSPTALGHLKLIQFLQRHFDGERQQVSRTMREEHHPYGTTALRFPKDTFETVKTLITDKVMENGSPTPLFHEELEQARLSEEADKDLLWEMTGTPNNPYRAVRA